ncbi:MAG: superoxide dismutase [Parachlamydiales bacterium]
MSKEIAMPATLQQQTLPDLEYDYNALEPVISAEIMELHHKKHHQAYINNYNKLAEQHHEAEAKGDVAKMIALQSGLKFNGGGHVNHTIFWTNLAPQNKGGGKAPSGPLADAIKAQWGSLDAFIEKFNARTAAIQGSGWGWLGYCPEDKRLEIATCANQDPLSTEGLVPLLGVDVWEHAYYLQYKNVRPDYLKAIWKVINWANVAERYQRAKG